ncbi:thioredoxin family protein [Acidobacteria bacterium AH-259-L09]|nr:thioredoxin family protein [Acidobacteria bacterium AH-259-L09]
MKARIAYLLFLCLMTFTYGEDKVRFRLGVEQETLIAGSQAEAVLSADIDEGWHLYSMSQPPGGPIPTSISVVENAVFSPAGSVKQPLPLTWFDQNFDINTEYFEGKVDFLIPFKVQPTAPSGTHSLPVKVRFMMCSDTLCLPPKNKTLMTQVNVSAPTSASAVAPAQAQLLSGEKLVKIETALSVDNVHPGSSFQVAVIADLQEGWHINAHQPTLSYLIPTQLSLEAVDGFTFGEIQYPDAVRLKFAFAEQELDVYEGRVIVRFPVTIAQSSSPGQKVMQGTFRYQACNDEICLAPALHNIRIPIHIASLEQPSRPINSDLFGSVAFTAPAFLGPGDALSLAQTDAAPRRWAVARLFSWLGNALSLAQTDLARLIEEHGLFVALPFLFVLGLALNLTPCVYPMIPVTIGYFSHQSEGKTWRVFGLGLMYLLGIAITYSTLGVIAALTGQMFGALLQNPWVLVSVAMIMVVLALSLFGMYQIQAPSFIRRKISGGSSGGILGALTMGLVVGIVAAPCVGPVTFGLLTYVGATGNPWLGFWMFFTLSLGLGAPYVALGTFSGGLKKLPKSGVWMLWVERLFGFALLGLALYFIAPLLPDRIVPWIVFALAVIAAVFLGWLDKSSNGGQAFYWLKKTAGVFILAIGLYAVIPQTPGATIAWQQYDPAVFDRARKEGRPVILDFYADWCIPCRELDRFTFSHEEVIEAVTPFMMMKVDLTYYESPEAELLRKQFTVGGVPTIIFIDAGGNEVQEARVVGYLGPDDFLRQVKRALGSG